MERFAKIVSDALTTMANITKEKMNALADYLTILTQVAFNAIRPSTALYLGPLTKSRGNLIEQIITIKIKGGQTQITFQGNFQSLLGCKIYGMFVNRYQTSGQDLAAFGVLPDNIFVSLVSGSSNVTTTLPLAHFIESSANSWYAQNGVQFFGFGGLEKQIVIGRNLNFSSCYIRIPPGAPVDFELDLHFWVEEAEYNANSSAKIGPQGLI